MTSATPSAQHPPPTEETPSLRPSARLHAASLAVYLFFAMAVLWPLFPLDRLGTHSHYGDAIINAYLVNWGQHVLPGAPWRYYHAPIFHPETYAAAHSSTNPFLSFATAPLRLLGNPLLSYNLSMLLAALLSGAAAYALAWYLTRSYRASIFAALVFGCNDDMLFHLNGHVNIASPIFIPLCFLAYLVFSRRPGWTRLLAVAFCLLGQFLCSWYLGFILTFGLLIFWLGDLLAQRRRPARPDLQLALALGVVLLVAYFLSRPYRIITDRYGSTRGLHEAAFTSADPLGYFLPPGDEAMFRTILGVHIGHSPTRFWPENSQFFGYLPWALALAGLGFLILRMSRGTPHFLDRPILLFAVLGAAGFILSLGPFLWWGSEITSIPLPYLLIHIAVPPLRFMRVASRYAVLVALFVAIVSAIVLARSTWFHPRSRLTRWALALLFYTILVFEFRPFLNNWASEPVFIWPFEMRAFEAVERHPEFETLAPVPFGHIPFLLHIAGRFPTTPSGFQGGIVDPRYDALKAMMPPDFSPEVMARYAALGVQGLLVYGEEEVNRARQSPHLECVECWSDAGLFELDFDDAGAIAGAAREIEALPQRVPLDEVPVLPAAGLEVQLPGRPKEEAMLVLIADDIFTFPSLEIRGVENETPASFFVELALADPGADRTQALLCWAVQATGDPRAGGQCAWADFAATGETKVVRFDLPELRPEAERLDLRLYPTITPYPGQRIGVGRIRMIPHSR